MMKAVELFTGAGGLGMGVSLAGFDPLAVVERDRWACDTIRQNQSLGNPIVSGWPLHEQDVRQFSYKTIAGEVDLVAGGPPCQPFSQGGRHRAFLDKRDMFPETVRAIRELKPKAFIIENVKGLTRKTFAEYFNYIKLQLEFPEVVAKEDETWLEHLGRLEMHQTSGSKDSSTYEVVFRVLNAANYGVPQKRERIFFVGFRHDLHAEWTFPSETHSLDALLHSQWVSGDYWDYHEVPSKQRPSLEPRLQNRIDKLKASSPRGSRWNTVRDALVGLPDPEIEHDQICLNHRFQPGARTYPGHTGSPIDLPAKTLKAGVHGVPGGENMLVKPNGEVRYFTVRESARLQTFPDTYVFHGSWTETMRQLGNAVPMALGQRVASSVAQALLRAQEDSLRQKLAKKRVS